MLEQSPIGTPAHPPSSTSYKPFSCGISPSSPPLRLPTTEPEAKTSSTVTNPDSHPDEFSTQQDEISSSFISTSSKSLDASKDVALLQIDFTVDPEYENDFLDIQRESAVEFRENLRSSSSTLQVCRRLQRQLNSHLLYTHAQVKAVSEILERMVSAESQCKITTPSTISPSETGQSSTLHLDDAEEGNQSAPQNALKDEGYFEGNTGEDGELDTEAFLMSLRRAAAPSRIRQHGDGGVYSTPRMRRNIMKRRRPRARPGG